MTLEWQCDGFGCDGSIFLQVKCKQTKKSTALLRSLREGRLQGKLLSLELERQLNTENHKSL